MSDNYIRNREGKIVAKWDGNWLRGVTSRINEHGMRRVVSWATGTSGCEN